jgi:SAM-dependent methyltransferase
LSKSPNPTLAYLYRRFLTNRLLPGVPLGRFLEIGVGRGQLFKDLIYRGFHGVCLDLNSDVIAEHRLRQAFPSRAVEFRVQNFFTIEERFDLIVAFEVLEHYEQDLHCLIKWLELLQPGGSLIFSVPAHVRQWTENDTRAGHARRYEKEELQEKLNGCGFQIENFWCYGFPILNLTYPLSVGLSRPAAVESQVSESGDVRMTDFQKTASSGNRLFPGVSEWLFQEALWFPWLQFQRFFLDSDLGTGYLVKCSTKRP